MVLYLLTLLFLTTHSSATEEENDYQVEGNVENRNKMDYFVLYPNQPQYNEPRWDDDFLYPPRSYYIHWIESEREKDWAEMNGDK